MIRYWFLAYSFNIIPFEPRILLMLEFRVAEVGHSILIVITPHHLWVSQKMLTSLTREKLFLSY